MKLNDRVPLACSHLGRVVWISADGAMMAVKGTYRRCPTCFKGSGTATVYLRPVE